MELKIVDYETAKLAKEAGFEKRWCDVAYREDDKKLYMDTGIYTDYPAPTQELLRQFLRTEHDIEVEITRTKDTNEVEYQFAIYHFIKNSPTIEHTVDFRGSYEQALEAGLEEALKYLLNQKE